MLIARWAPSKPDAFKLLRPVAAIQLSCWDDLGVRSDGLTKVQHGTIYLPIIVVGEAALPLLRTIYLLMMNAACWVIHAK